MTEQEAWRKNGFRCLLGRPVFPSLPQHLLYGGLSFYADSHQDPDMPTGVPEGEQGGKEQGTWLSRPADCDNNEVKDSGAQARG